MADDNPGSRSATTKQRGLPDDLRATSLRGLVTIISGPETGRVFALDTAAETIIGRHPGASVCVDHPTLSWRHARIVPDEGGFFIEDLSSTNGTYVGGSEVGAGRCRKLLPGDVLHLGRTVMACFNVATAREEELLRQLRESSVRDSLTGLFNRRYFELRLSTEVAYARRGGLPMALLFLDVDEFKRFNDAWGHAAGDAVLRGVARVLRRIVRLEDVVARWGGDELAILARGAPHAHAQRLAERLCRAVRTAHVRTGTEVVLVPTVSVGLASFDELAPGDPPARLLAVADARLYAAKRAGRNRVCGTGDLEAKVAMTAER